MAKKRFNWKIAIVFVISVTILIVTTFCLRQWQRSRTAETAYKQGLDAYENRLWTRAADNLGRYLASGAADIEILLKYAQCQLNIRPLKAGNIQQAAAAYRKILRIDKNNPKAAGKLVSLYLQTNSASEAELIAGRYLEKNKSSEIDTMLAMALAKQRKFKESESRLRNIIKEYPHHVMAYEVLGRLTEEQPEAFSSTPKYWYDQAINNNPTSASAFIARACYYLRIQETSKAIEDLEKAEKLVVTDIAVRLRLAEEFLKVGMFENAGTQLEKIYAQEPTNQQLWRIKATLAIKSMSKQRMLAVAQMGLRQLYPDVWDFMPIAAELFIRSDEFSKANDCLDKLKQKDIDSATIALLEGLLAEVKGQNYRAISFLLEAQQAGDKSQQCYLGLVKLYVRVGDMQSAILQLRQLTSEQPESFKAHLALAKLLGQLGNWAEAAEQSRLAGQIAPDNTEAALVHLQTQLQLTTDQNQNDERVWQKIETQLATLENTDADRATVKHLQFQLAMARGKLNDAEKILLQLKTYKNNRPELITAEIDLLVARGQIDQAITKLYSHIKESGGDLATTKYLAALLATYRSEEDCEKTLKELIQRADSAKLRREITLLLADLYDRLGKNEKTYQLLTALSPELLNEIAIKRRLLHCTELQANAELAQQLVDEIKNIEGKMGWQWRYEQANILLNGKNSQRHLPRIIALLKKNVSTNPGDQKSRVLLAAAYDKAGQLQLAVTTYRQALNRSPGDLNIIAATITAMYKAKEYDQADKILAGALRQNLTHPQLSKLQVKSYLRQGKLNSAEVILEDLLAKDPDNDSVCFALALLKIRQDKYDQAEYLLNRLKAKNPKSMAITAAMIELNIRQEKPSEALALCEQAVKDMGNASAYILQGKTYQMLGQNDLAEKNFEKAIQIEPNNIQGWISKSDFYISTGKTQLAIQDIQQAMKMAPDNLQIQKRAIAILLSSGDMEKILQGQLLLDKALLSNPDDIDLRLYKSRCLLAKGTAPAIEQAEHILGKITQSQPKSTEAWILWAQIYLKKSQPGKTMNMILRGLSYSPNDKNLLLFKARSEAAMSAELAIPTLKVLNEHNPTDTEIALELAKVYMETGKNDEAIALLQNLLFQSREDDLAKINITLAVALYKNGDKDRSQEKFDLLYKSRTGDSSVLLAETNLLKKEQKWDVLYRKSADWFENNPNDTETPVTIARNLIATGDDIALNAAENLLRQVLDHNPNCLQAMGSLAMLLQITGRAEGAVKLYEHILLTEPNAVMAINNLAWIMSEQQGQYYKALELAQSGLKKAPQYIDLIDTRGLIYYRLGQYDKAAEDFSRCIELYPQHSSSLPRSYLHFAQTLVALGRENKAIENLRKTLDLSDKNGGLSATEITEAQKLLKELLNKNNNVTFAN